MAQPDVSRSVGSIIASFANGLDVFKRLRERRRAKKRSKQNEMAAKKRADEEMQLSHSLRQGPMDIEAEYSRNLQLVGERFARGDAIAHASLTEILLKLNTGLVQIISSFLGSTSNNGNGHGHRKGTKNLDYASLTTLSNNSRAEAIDALGQLYQRLSQTRLALHQPMNYHYHYHYGQPTNQSDTQSNSASTSTSTKTRQRQKDFAIARKPLKNLKSASQTQLVVVRPRNAYQRRTTAPAAVAPTMSPPSSPPMPCSPHCGMAHPNASTPALLLQQGPMPAQPQLPYGQADMGFVYSDPLPQAPFPGAYRGGGSGEEGKTRRTSTASNTNKTLPQRPKTRQAPPQSQTQRKLTRSSQNQPSPHIEASPKPPDHPQTKSKDLLYQQENLPPLAPSPTSSPCNARPTSAYTFASASTKLGEIPMRNWREPFDHAEAERLNAEAVREGRAGVRGRKQRRASKEEKTSSDGRAEGKAAGKKGILKGWGLW